MRTAAADPHFLVGVLDVLMSDEQLLLTFAAEAGYTPDAVVAAHDRLSRR